jgi:hypothetical protein
MLARKKLPLSLVMGTMTRQLLIALVLTGFVALAIGGAITQLANGRRPVLFARRLPAFS